MALSRQEKQTIIGEYRRAEEDSGSPEVQIALLSANIDQLQEHFSAHRKDHASRHGLIRMVNRRRKLLDYLQKRNNSRYLEIIRRLKLRR